MCFLYRRKYYKERRQVEIKEGYVQSEDSSEDSNDEDIQDQIKDLEDLQQNWNVGQHYTPTAFLNLN